MADGAKDCRDQWAFGGDGQVSAHGVVVLKRELFFMSFKGDNKASSLDQVTLPPRLGMTAMTYNLGEWLKREGHDWESLSEKRLCELCCDYWNRWLQEGEAPRRFDRLAGASDVPPASWRKR